MTVRLRLDGTERIGIYVGSDAIVDANLNMLLDFAHVHDFNRKDAFMFIELHDVPGPVAPPVWDRHHPGAFP